ncbi:hypothetical protein K443DRAFT_134551 [Laccaria amethystina LaAM-08-1]|uniref:Uncharacterized protein n=1 Tax=Laccaria amethystina LaAM-08-1 TaxID=1095629 RepID=A0A0C9WT65_9AGAR|nr:hypothetical protein K443DRAFT_134551 [Laccaria amethystina LaAM-08-1]
MPSHSKPVVTDSDSGSTVSVSVNPQTLITIFGVATSARKQKVQAELKDGNSNVQSSSSFDGVQKESLYLEDDSTKKTIVWGPFDEQMTIELSFSHQDSGEDDWEPSSHSTNDLQTAISLIPIDDGENDDENYQNTILNVTRMTGLSDNTVLIRLLLRMAIRVFSLFL